MPTIALADKTGCKPGKLLPQKCPTLPLVVTINTLNASRKKKEPKTISVNSAACEGKWSIDTLNL